MENKEKRLFAFTCANEKCGAENTFEAFVSPTESGAKTDLTRCIFCGFENKITLPDGVRLPTDSGIWKGKN